MLRNVKFDFLYFFFRPEEDHLNSYVKPELLKRIQKAFPVDFKNDVLSRNKCRDMIIECVQFSMRVCIYTLSLFFNDNILCSR